MCATTGKDGRAAAVELRSGKKGAVVRAPGRMHIHSDGAFLTMEHLLATMVSLLGSPLLVGQATDTIFSELKLASLK
jgi:hypothetical protein